MRKETNKKGIFIRKNNKSMAPKRIMKHSFFQIFSRKGKLYWYRKTQKCSIPVNMIWAFVVGKKASIDFISLMQRVSTEGNWYNGLKCKYLKVYTNNFIHEEKYFLRHERMGSPNILFF